MGRIGWFLLFFAIFVEPAAAREALGVFDQWGAFRDDRPPRCFAIAEPPVRYSKRDWRPFASVATWPGRNVRGQLHIRLRKAKLPGTPIMLRIGNRRFPLVGGGGDGLLDVAVDVEVSAEQVFAGMDGPITYLLADHLRHLTSVRFVEADEDPASPGTPSTMVPAAWARHHKPPPYGAWEPLGRSPFTTFTFDPSSVVMPYSIITPEDIATATELVLFLHVEYSDLQSPPPTPAQPNPPATHKLTWIQSCVREQDACDDGFDNDNDGDHDCADSDCANTQGCAP